MFASYVPQLFKERALLLVSRETIRRALHRLELVPLEKTASGPARRRSQHEATKTQRDPEDAQKKEAGSFFQDETKLELNPRVGFCAGCARASRRSFLLPAPIEKRGSAERSTSEERVELALGGWSPQEGFRAVYEKLLEHLRRTYRCHKQLHLATDNDSSHTSERVKEYLREEGKRIHACIRSLHRAPRAIPWNRSGGECTRR